MQTERPLAGSMAFTEAMVLVHTSQPGNSALGSLDVGNHAAKTGAGGGLCFVGKHSKSEVWKATEHEGIKHYKTIYLDVKKTSALEQHYLKN